VILITKTLKPLLVECLVDHYLLLIITGFLLQESLKTDFSLVLLN